MSPSRHRYEDESAPPLDVDKLRVKGSLRNTWLIGVAIFMAGVAWADLKSDAKRTRDDLNSIMTASRQDHDTIMRIAGAVGVRKVKVVPASTDE